MYARKSIYAVRTENLKANGADSVWPRTLDSLWLKALETQQTENSSLIDIG
jgi:hypothetical protein